MMEGVVSKSRYALCRLIRSLMRPLHRCLSCSGANAEYLMHRGRVRMHAYLTGIR